MARAFFMLQAVNHRSIPNIQIRVTATEPTQLGSQLLKNGHETHERTRKNSN